MSAEKKTKTMTLNLDPDVIKKLRIVCVQEEIGPSSLAQEAFSLWWKTKGYEEKQGPLFPLPSPAATNE